MILIQYLSWHFFDMPKNILRAWKNFLWFTLNYFSVPMLITSFFSHWHKYYYPYGRAWDLWRYFEAFVFNTFSRIIGVILRTLLIITGIILEIAVILIGAAILIVWLLLPFLLLAGLWLGFKYVF